MQSYLVQVYISLNPSRVEQHYTIIYKKWLKLYIETVDSKFLTLSVRNGQSY